MLQLAGYINNLQSNAIWCTVYEVHPKFRTTCSPMPGGGGGGGGGGYDFFFSYAFSTPFGIIKFMVVSIHLFKSEVLFMFIL